MSWSCCALVSSFTDRESQVFVTSPLRIESVNNPENNTCFTKGSSPRSQKSNHSYNFVNMRPGTPRVKTLPSEGIVCRLMVTMPVFQRENPKFEARKTITMHDTGSVERLGLRCKRKWGQHSNFETNLFHEQVMGGLGQIRDLVTTPGFPDPACGGQTSRGMTIHRGARGRAGNSRTTYHLLSRDAQFIVLVFRMSYS